MKQTRHDRCASVVRVRAVSEPVKPRSCDCEASSSVQTGYSLLHEMLQWGGNVGSFCDPARDICLTSFTIMGRRGRQSPPPPITSHHPITPPQPPGEPNQASNLAQTFFISRHVSFCTWASVYVWYGIHTHAPVFFLCCCFCSRHISLLFQTYTHVLYDFVPFRVHFMRGMTDQDVHNDWWCWWFKTRKWWQR